MVRVKSFLMTRLSKDEVLEMIKPQDSYQPSKRPAFGKDQGEVYYVTDNGDYAHIQDGAYHHSQWIMDLETGEAYIMRYNILGDKSWTFPKQWRVSKKLSELGDDKNIYRIHTKKVSMTNHRKVLGNGGADFLAKATSEDEGVYKDDRYYEAQTFTKDEDIYKVVERIQTTGGLTGRERWIDHIRLKGHGIR